MQYAHGFVACQGDTTASLALGRKKLLFYTEAN